LLLRLARPLAQMLVALLELSTPAPGVRVEVSRRPIVEYDVAKIQLLYTRGRPIRCVLAYAAAATPWQNAWLMQPRSNVLCAAPTALPLKAACIEEHGHDKIEPVTLEEARCLMGVKLTGLEKVLRPTPAPEDAH
jgi:hypothetical protein